MALSRQHPPEASRAGAAGAPSRSGRQGQAPRPQAPAEGHGARDAYDLIASELLLDGQARLNLATFVTTWMPPTAAALMGLTAEKNMIDKDEYPMTAEIESRCVDILADLWNSPEAEHAHRVLDHRLERGGHARGPGA